jgi:hypothetical protein
MGMTLHLRHIENHLRGVSMCKIFLKFLNKMFLSIVLSPRNCALILCTLRAGSYIMKSNFEDLDFLNYSLDYFQAFYLEIIMFVKYWKSCYIFMRSY